MDTRDPIWPSGLEPKLCQTASWSSNDGICGFDIHTDSAFEFMHVRLWGVWANAQTDGLVVSHAKAITEMKANGARHGHFITMVDMRQKEMSAPQIIAEFQRSFRANSPSRRTAIIVAPGLPSTMADDIAPPGRVIIAYSEAEALSWLFE